MTLLNEPQELHLYEIFSKEFSDSSTLGYLLQLDHVDILMIQAEYSLSGPREKIHKVVHT